MQNHAYSGGVTSPSQEEDQGIKEPNQTSDAGLLLVIHQSLVEVAGTDGQAEEGRVVFEVLAVETDPTTVTCRLKKPMRKKPPFLRWVGHGLSGVRPQ